MYKMFVLCLTLFVSFAWIQAQEGYPTSKSSQPAPGQEAGSGQSGVQGRADGTEGAPQESRGDMGTQQTVQGCLETSGSEYTLLSDNGKTYQLTGDTAKLGDHVGHEVQITGASTVKTRSATQDSTASSAKELRALKVQSMKHIANSCQAKQ